MDVVVVADLGPAPLPGFLHVAGGGLVAQAPPLQVWWGRVALDQRLHACMHHRTPASSRTCSMTSSIHALPPCLPPIAAAAAAAGAQDGSSHAGDLAGAAYLCRPGASNQHASHDSSSSRPSDPHQVLPPAHNPAASQPQRRQQQQEEAGSPSVKGGYGDRPSLPPTLVGPAASCFALPDGASCCRDRQPSSAAVARQRKMGTVSTR